MASSSDACAGIDDTFHLYATYCRGGFDFTLLFEETILCILPISLLLIVAPFRILYLFKKRKKAVLGVLLPFKVAGYAALGATQLALLILWALPGATRTRASIPAQALDVFATLTLCFLSYAEHSYSVQPSSLLNIYLSLTLLFNGAHARTLWLRAYNGHSNVIAMVSTISIALKLGVLLLETLEKKEILRPEYRAYPPEATAGIFNKGFFWWLNSLFRTGFSKTLTVDDLFSLDKKLISKRYEAKMGTEWSRVTKKSSNSLFTISLKTLKWPLLSIVPFRAFLIALNFCQPLLINRVILLSEEPITVWTNHVGYGLIGAYFLVYTGIAISTGQYQHLTYRAITMVRGGLVGMLCRKTTDLSLQDIDPATSLTLMSADIERIVQGWQTMNEIWANPIEIAIAVYLLEVQLQVACVIPVAVAVASLIGSILVMGFVVSRQEMWLKAIEKRISSTTSMLETMKGIKMSGLKDIMFNTLQKLRVDELNISKAFRRLLVWNMAFGAAYVGQIFAPIITLAVFAAISRNRGSGTVLDIARIYTSLSLFALLTEPLATLVMSLSTFLASIGCFTRIQEFLDKDVRIDSRGKQLFFSDNIMKHLEPLAESIGSNTTAKELESTESLKLSCYSDAVVVQGASFGWDAEKEPLLKNITFALPRSKVTILVGPVGCGKSTLLKAILSEVPRLEGLVHIASESFAFCDQTPWHMNETIRNSILAMLSFDEKWYNTVIHACALTEDFHHLPKGDQTVIGSKGVALSMGQSQRVALARAIYARRKTVLLDDSFTGLDPATENHIFYSLMGRDGLLRRIQSTVLIASSSVKRLPYADHIIVLGADGSITEQGTFNVLASTGGFVSSFNLPSPDWNYQLEEFTDPKSSQGPIPTQTAEYLEEEANKRTGDVSIYLYYIKSIGWAPVLIFIFCISAFIFCISFPSIWLKWWAASNTQAPYGKMGYYLGIYVMLGVLALGFLIVSCWQMIITMVPKSGVMLHQTLLSTVLSAPMSFFTSTDIGVTINRFSQDLQLIDMELPVAALNTFATFVLCIAQMTLIGVASGYTAISFPVVLIVLYIIQKFYLRTSRQLRLMDLEAKAPLYSQFTECLSGLATIRAFKWQEAMQDKSRRLLDRSQKPFYLLFAVQRWLTLVLDLMVAGIAVILIVLFVVLRGSIDPGYVGVGLLNIILFSQSIKLLVVFWTNLETHIGAIARIKIFEGNLQSESLPTEASPVPPSWPSKGAIEFNSVSAGYGGNNLVLRDVSFSIQSGEKIGICGRTGSGKSSLVLSIFRMIELANGSITIDGVDLSTIPRQEIRSRITGVSQDPFLINGSVRMNLDPTGCCSDSAIIDALQSVQLMAVVQEKGGLNADIEDLFLSHGQKQLLCLARAMLRTSTILILDEATSNIDTKTDELMQRVIRQKFSSHTVLAVAHKLDTILDFDRVAVLDAGQLIELDDPYTLLSSTDSAFAKLYTCTTAEDDASAVGDDPITMTTPPTASDKHSFG